jgi:pimeloyl-ACP methyl ester carboxylesterase
MAAYQSRANGDLPPADLYVSLNAHPGRPEVLTAWMDPSVVDENDPVAADPDLDMFAPGRTPPFDAEFVERYRQGQEDRNDRITHWVRDELSRLDERGLYDRVFTLCRTWADLRFVDLSLDPSTRNPGCYLGDPKHANYSPFGIGSACTLRTWLSMWSLEASPCRGEPHLRRITVPSLVVQSTGDKGVFPSDAKAIHEALAATDKQLEWLPGEHYFEDGGRDDVADLVAAWVDKRS